MRLVRASARCGCVAALVAATTHCRSPTEVTLELSTDTCGSGYQGTSITVGRADESIEVVAPATVTRQCNGQDIGTLVVLPHTSKDEQFEVKVVTGLDVPVEQCTPPAYAGCIVARRLMRFIPHDPLELPIELLNVCKNEPCTATTTCVNGGCVSAVIPNPSQCDTPTGCEQGVLGDGGVDAPADATVDQFVPDSTLDTGEGSMDGTSADGPSDGLPGDAPPDAPIGDSGCPLSPTSQCVTCCDTLHMGYGQMYAMHVVPCLCGISECVSQCGCPLTTPVTWQCIQCAVTTSEPAANACHGMYTMCQQFFAPQCPDMLSCVEECQ
jgi:hypothetical protein